MLPACVVSWAAILAVFCFLPLVQAADECESFNATCVSVGQQCTDPDENVSDDWKCECTPPDVGMPVLGAPAVCVTPFDECELPVNNATCTAAGQQCKDNDELTSDDWVCECTPPDVGSPKKGGAATCISPLDECELPANNATCTAAGQECKDVDEIARDDWVCECTPPDVGSPVKGAAATCISPLDECELPANNATCTSAGQMCKDSDEITRDDWVCECTPPDVGSPAPRAAATCISPLDECELPANNATCTAAGQECKDLDEITRDDWVCGCTPPAVGSPVKGAAATCISPLDECEIPANNATCTAAGQECKDSDEIARDDWVCECTPPDVGSPVKGAAATCISPLDECELPANNATCAAAGQECKDVDEIARDDWVCECTPPDVGPPVTGAPATCVSPLDECDANNATCTSVGQICKDPDEIARGDWVCECTPPDVGTPVQGAPATCVTPFDECELLVNNATCAAAGQMCKDEDEIAVDDWVCECTPPDVGTPVKRAAATCVSPFDECELPANNATCTAAGQECKDVDEIARDDWVCECTPPDVGPPVTGAPATCVSPLDECEVSANNATCAAAGQECKDTDEIARDDWVCECTPPLVGTPGNQTAATCVTPVDECATPANNVTCTAVGQICRDPSLQLSDDWMCECTPPDVGAPVVKAVATCITPLDECEVPANNGTCTAAGQECKDADEISRDDWACECTPPLAGPPGNQTAATCVTPADECAIPANDATCTAVGQICKDPSVNVADDWVCECTPPDVGVPAVKAVATCSPPSNECANPGNRIVCEMAQQRCNDPNQGVTGDWVCECDTPAAGQPVQGAPAVCGDCVTVTVCTDASQRCIDPDQSVSDDWSCECIPPAVGAPAKGAAATCVAPLDECAVPANNMVCTAARQICKDTDQIARDDWVCECTPPAVGAPVKIAAATCVAPLNECAIRTNNAVCTAAVQICKDRDEIARDDWVCECTPPAVGTPAKGGAATCVAPVDECATLPNNVTCTTAGQTCNDPDRDVLDDWVCECTPPSVGMAVTGATATCVAPVDECATPANNATCAQAEQICFDPDKSLSGDWVCQCTPPSVGAPVNGSAATCVKERTVLVPVVLNGGPAGMYMFMVAGLVWFLLWLVWGLYWWRQNVEIGRQLKSCTLNAAFAEDNPDKVCACVVQRPTTHPLIHLQQVLVSVQLSYLERLLPGGRGRANKSRGYHQT